MLKHSFLLISLMGTSSLFASNYAISVSADTTKFDYAETTSSGLLDTERADYGKVSGFSVALTPRHNGFYLSASYAKGNTDYVGSILGSGNPYGSAVGITRNEISDYTFGYKATTQLDPRGGWEMPVSVGIGYRRWLRQLGYDELYDWGYYDAGVGLHYAFSSKLSLGVDGNYRKAFNSQMYENLHGYTFNLQNVHGYKITVPLEVKLDQKLSFFGSYNYEYWNIGASNPVGGYYEPDSETKNETLSFGLKLNF